MTGTFTHQKVFGRMAEFAFIGCRTCISFGTTAGMILGVQNGFDGEGNGVGWWHGCGDAAGWRT